MSFKKIKLPMLATIIFYTVGKFLEIFNIVSLAEFLCVIILLLLLKKDYEEYLDELKQEFDDD